MTVGRLCFVVRTGRDLEDTVGVEGKGHVDLRLACARALDAGDDEDELVVGVDVGPLSLVHDHVDFLPIHGYNTTARCLSIRGKASES